MKVAPSSSATERLYAVKKVGNQRGRGHSLVQKSQNENAELNQIMSLVHGTPTVSLTNSSGTQLHSTTPIPLSVADLGNNDTEDDSRLLSAPNSVTQEFDDTMVDDGTAESFRESVDSSKTNRSLLYRMDTCGSGASQQDIIEALQSQVLMLQETLHGERASKSLKQPQKLVSGAQFRITGKGASVT